MRRSFWLAPFANHSQNVDWISRRAGVNFSTRLIPWGTPPSLGSREPAVKASLILPLVFVVGLFLPTNDRVASATTKPRSRASENVDQSAISSRPENSVTIPGPLRSFLRMSGINQNVTPSEVLPQLAHNVVLHGYHLGKATEYLILLRGYLHQSKELSALAGQGGSIRVNGCKDAEPLLRILGYRTRGECGRNGMALETANPERAFLSVDSGFPLLDLEESLQRDGPFEYGYTGSAVPVLFAADDWIVVASQKEQENRDFLESLLHAPGVARLYWAISQIEPETRVEMKEGIGLAKLLPLAPALDHYGTQFCIRDGTVVVPGGREAEKEWQAIVGASPRAPREFILQLLKKDHGWAGTYFDAMARTSQGQQEHFTAGHRLSRYYGAFRAAGDSEEASAGLPFRPAPALMVLVTRLKWDGNGEPYVPGNLQAWNEILRQKGDSKVIRHRGKRFVGWRTPDQLAEAMFAFSRLGTEGGPLQAYLCLSELDHRRPPGRRLSNQTVLLLAERYADFGDQYMMFSEFPDLSDNSIARYMTAAELLTKIPDHVLRGNAMGIFQANVGLWQILARQGEIERTQLNSSWMEMIKPFSEVSTAAQLVTAGRSSIEQVFLAGTGNRRGSQNEFINLLAGAQQRTAEGHQVRMEMADRIRSVMEDQRLVSMDTLFALDDGLRNPEQGAKSKAELAALAGELREFEMPRPIFTNSERYEWAAGTYNNRHTELQMRTDLVKVIRSSKSPKQVEAARGQLATFLRDTLVGLNYAYYEPPGSQVLHNNPLFVRSHDFSGDTIQGVEHMWQAPRLFGAGSPAGGGAHMIGSLADLPYVLAEAEQDFIAPDHVQALIWQQFVPGLLSNAIVPRWWNVSRNELHAVALYQRAGEELLMASSKDEDLKGKVMAVLSDRMVPERSAWLEQTIRAGRTNEMFEGISPADGFYLTAKFRERFSGELERDSAAGRELEGLIREEPEEVNWERLSRDFGVIHPVFTQTYARELIDGKPFPALGGNYNRLMGECWDSGNLYWARLADEMGESPVLLNRIVPVLTRRMVERISASDLEDWPAALRALRETGKEFREGKISLLAGNAQTQN
jgi:hypothetical protein